MERHDIHDFMISSNQEIAQEYERIRKRASQDPGTAGDQGEENWANLLRNWLPPYFQIVTKGRILTDSNYASPQIDVLVLYPSYPKILLNKKLYLSSGVAAAFECKLTLEAGHIENAVKSFAEIQRNLPKRIGSPYKELNSTITFGLLAHSHSWKNKNSKSINNVENALIEADKTFVTHPLECIDFITVSDLASWHVFKQSYGTMQYLGGTAKDIIATTGYMCSPIGDKVADVQSDWLKGQADYFTPISVLFAGLFSKLSWAFPDMRPLDLYFRKTNLFGRGEGQHSRLWNINEIYSPIVADRVSKGLVSNGVFFDKWSLGFF